MFNDDSFDETEQKKKIGRKLDLKSTLTQNPNNNTENG